MNLTRLHPNSRNVTWFVISGIVILGTGAMGLALSAPAFPVVPPAHAGAMLATRSVNRGAIQVRWLQATETPALGGERVIVLSEAAAVSVAPQANPRYKCDLKELQLGWHISSKCSFDETESSAVGPMVCQVARNSCAFTHLIDNRDPGILFYREEPAPFSDEDSLMHPAMLLPLARLRDKIQQEWQGEAQLMVTDAYDSLGDHDLNQLVLGKKYSQHFEGRSIDLVTWPVDPARYALLCALALDAGFDWVHNEGDHCHASIAADSVCTLCSPITSSP